MEAESQELLELVYDELRALAMAKMRRESPDLTLQATALVHEAYLRIVGPGNDKVWASRAQFFAAAAEAMRRILVEQARSRNRLKRGGGMTRQDLSEIEFADHVGPDELLRIHEAIDKLTLEDHLAAEIVKMRYFTGMSIDQVAEALEISRSTAYEHWAYARAWLITYIRDPQ